MATGWGAFPTKGTTIKATKRGGSSPTMRRLTDTNTGKKFEVPEDDYNMFVQFIKDQGIDSSVEEYISNVFEDYEPSADKRTKHVYDNELLGSSESTDFEVEGCGHIKFLEYKSYNGKFFLRVTFWDDKACVYINVPTAVAGQLKYLAESKNETYSAVGNGKRHVLGMRFWDLIRVRGTIHGSRYSFRYSDAPDKAKGVYAKGSSEPDFSSGKYVFVPKSTKDNSVTDLVLKKKDELTDKDKLNLAEIRQVAREDEPFDEEDAKYNVQRMRNVVQSLNIDPAIKKGILRQMDSMKDEATIRNYLGVLGLYM